MVDNLYDILEVPKNASTADIKKAYKKLAMKHHPDKGGDQEHFKKISEAYTILSDDEKRRRYDQFGTIDDQNMPDMNDIFSNIFGFPFGGMGGMPGMGMNMGGHHSQPNKSMNRQITLDVSLEEVMLGATIPFRLHRKTFSKGNRCGDCQGNGHRMQQINLGIGIMTRSITECPTCSGIGHLFSEKDATTVEEVIQVPIPKGIPHGKKLVIRCKADEYPGREPGDVVITISYKDHEFYKVLPQSLDIQCTIPLSLSEFLFGFEKDLRLLDKTTVTIKQPFGKAMAPVISSQHLQKVIPHKGFSYHHQTGRLIMMFEIVLPSQLSPIESIVKSHCPVNLHAYPFLKPVSHAEGSPSSILLLDRY